MHPTISGGRGAVSLSERQRAALTLSAAGLTSAEVADVLGISVAEIRAHLSSAIAVLGARSKLEAVIVALRSGLIEVGEEQPPDRATVRA